MDLADALAKVSKALPIKKTIPILDGIKLSAYGDTLTLSATDIDFSISKEIKTDIEMEGEALVNGKLLNELAHKLSSSSQVSLSDIRENCLTVISDDSMFTINLMNISEYPPIQSFEHEVSFNMLQKELKELISRTNFAASTDDVRPILKGCLIETKDNLIKCVALDGYRLAIATKELAQKEINYSGVVPAKNLAEIAKLLENEEDSVNVKFSKNKMFVDLGHTKVTTSLLTGNFINYANTIPSNFECQVVLEKKVFEEAIERASIMSRIDKTNLIRIEIKDQKIFITSNSELGDAKEVIPAKTSGKDMVIGFNAKFVSECLKVIEDKFIEFSIKSAVTACLIRPCDGNKFLYLIVPVKVR